VVGSPGNTIGVGPMASRGDGRKRGMYDVSQELHEARYVRFRVIRETRNVASSQRGRPSSPERRVALVRPTLERLAAARL